MSSKTKVSLLPVWDRSIAIEREGESEAIFGGENVLNEIYNIGKMKVKSGQGAAVKL